MDEETMDQAQDLVGELIARDRATMKRILVIGDAMLDAWSIGDLAVGQENCPKFTEREMVVTPGGAANAARQLCNWNAHAKLCSPISDIHLADVNTSFCWLGRSMPVKRRFLVDGKVIFRLDESDELTDVEDCRQLAIASVRNFDFDAVLISDYDKGFLDVATIREIRDVCHSKIPLVIDVKRRWQDYLCTDYGYDLWPIIKCNGDWWKQNYHGIEETGLQNTFVHTLGPDSPDVYQGKKDWQDPNLARVSCVNHVGAGDCFSAHLTLALAHGFTVPEAVRMAHSAGRVFVQHPYARPPWPHEVRRDLHGEEGKVLDEGMLVDLADATHGQKVVFTNGVFRIGTHAGHCAMLQWARQQGTLLVVGLNDDVSARSNKGPENFILPLAERLECVTALECVDYVVPFSAHEPIDLIRALRPAVLAKGAEFVGRHVPGDELVQDLRFAPETRFPRHCTDLVAEIRG